MRLTSITTRRLAAVAVLTGTMLAGGGVAATSAQASTLGIVKLFDERVSGPTPSHWQMAWDECNQRYRGGVRSVKFVKSAYAWIPIENGRGGYRTLRGYSITYLCSDSPNP